MKYYSPIVYACVSVCVCVYVSRLIRSQYEQRKFARTHACNAHNKTEIVFQKRQHHRQFAQCMHAIYVLLSVYSVHSGNGCTSSTQRFSLHQSVSQLLVFLFAFLAIDAEPRENPMKLFQQSNRSHLNGTRFQYNMYNGRIFSTPHIRKQKMARPPIWLQTRISTNKF